MVSALARQGAIMGELRADKQHSAGASPPAGLGDDAVVKAGRHWEKNPSPRGLTPRGDGMRRTATSSCGEQQPSSFLRHVYGLLLS